jgi:3-hydroxyacyl-CoA dehydrogenase
MQAMDLVTGEYRPQQKPVLPEIEAARRDLRILLMAPGKAGTYAFRVLAQTIAYAATLIPGAAASVADIDEAMRLGYNWKWGPFELADKLGSAWLVEQLTARGMTVPKLLADVAGKSFYRVAGGKRQFLGTDGGYHDIVRAPGVLLLEDIKLAAKPVLKNGSAALWDIGAGVACFEFTSKSNVLDDKIIELLGKSIEIVGTQFKALVIYNEGENFSLGANLGLALFAANIAAWGEIDKLIAGGQQTIRR